MREGKGRRMGRGRERPQKTWRNVEKLTCPITQPQVVDWPPRDLRFFPRPRA